MKDDDLRPLVWATPDVVEALERERLLRASAPEMLAMLKEAGECIEAHFGERPLPATWYNIAALLKRLGE